MDVPDCRKWRREASSHTFASSPRWRAAEAEGVRPVGTVVPGAPTMSHRRGRASPIRIGRRQADVAEQRGRVATGDVVAASRILDVRGPRRRTGCDAGDCGDQAAYVSFGRVDAGACPHCPWHPGAVTSAHLVAEVDDLVLGEAQEPHHVGVGAEAAMPDADGLLGRQPGCH